MPGLPNNPFNTHTPAFLGGSSMPFPLGNASATRNAANSPDINMEELFKDGKLFAFINGRMIKNSNHSNIHHPTVPQASSGFLSGEERREEQRKINAIKNYKPSDALVGVSSYEEISQIEEETGQEISVAESAQRLYEKVHDPEFLAKFNNPAITGDMVFLGLSKMGAKEEMSFPLIEAQLPAHRYTPRFHIDDSGSMGLKTDVFVPLFRTNGLPELDESGKQKFRQLTRHEEAEQSICDWLEMAVWLPIHEFHFDFLNSPRTYVIQRGTMLPEEFLEYAKAEVRKIFAENLPTNGTPVAGKMEKKWLSKEKCDDGLNSHVFLFDGRPNFGEEKRCEDALLTRAQPKNNPFTFWSCTNEDDEVEWLKVFEAVAAFTNESDSWEDELAEWLKNQGIGFPSNRGTWKACRWAGHLPENTHSLDGVDEPIAFIKLIMEECFLGRKVSREEFKHYVSNMPLAEIKNASNRVVHQVKWMDHFDKLWNAKHPDDVPAIKQFKLKMIEVKLDGMTSIRRKRYIEALEAEGREIPRKYSKGNFFFGSNSSVPQNPIQQQWMTNSASSSTFTTFGVSAASSSRFSEKSPESPITTPGNSTEYRQEAGSSQSKKGFVPEDADKGVFNTDQPPAYTPFASSSTIPSNAATMPHGNNGEDREKSSRFPFRRLFRFGKGG